MLKENTINLSENILPIGKDRSASQVSIVGVPRCTSMPLVAMGSRKKIPPLMARPLRGGGGGERPGL